MVLQTKYMIQVSKLSSLSEGRVAPLAAWDDFQENSVLLMMKGAPEVLLSRCGYILDPSGNAPTKLTPEILGKLAGIQEGWAQHGQRVLLLARKIVHDALDKNPEDLEDLVQDECQEGLIIVGLIGLTDPLKPDIKHTVRSVAFPNCQLR